MSSTLWGAGFGAYVGTCIGTVIGAVGGPPGMILGSTVGGAIGGAIGGAAVDNVPPPPPPIKKPTPKHKLDEPPVPKPPALTPVKTQQQSSGVYGDIKAGDIPNVDKLPWSPSKVVSTLNENRQVINELSKGERIKKDNEDLSTMVLSAKYGKWNVVFEILQKKPYLINCIPTERSWAALHQAVYYNTSEVVRKLLAVKSCDPAIKAKANQNNHGEAGITPYRLAQKYGHHSLLLLLDRSTDNADTLAVTFISKDKGTEFLTNGVPYFDLASSFLRRDILDSLALEGCRLLYITEKMYKLFESNWKYVQKTVADCICPFDKHAAGKLEKATSTDQLKREMIGIYTSEAVYRQVNAALHRASATEYPVSDDLLLSLYSLFLTAILLHSDDLTKETQTTYRGTSFSPEQAQLYKEGTTFHWMSFTSTTMKKDIAQRFAQRGTQPVKAVFVIDNSQKSMWSPRDIMAFSEFGHEEEVVHPPFARFYVTSVNKLSQYTEYRLQLL